MARFLGSKSDCSYGQMRHLSIRTRDRNHWGKKNKILGNRPKPTDEKYLAGQSLFFQRIEAENKD